MNELFQYNPVVLALFATLGTWGITAAGAAAVFLFGGVGKRTLNMLLGFAAGIMTAASFWSLLQPAIEKSAEGILPPWLVVTASFLMGGCFLYLSDRLLDLACSKFSVKAINEGGKRSALLIFAITLHNIPEGLAVGVAFGCAGISQEPTMMLAALSLALGIGLQNFPEGAAVSLPLRREGFSKGKSFFYGQASGMVEPVAGVIGAALVLVMQVLLPWALAFAAGAMIYVVAGELIPEAGGGGDKTNRVLTTCGVLLGFAMMMALDVGLG